MQDLNYFPLDVESNIYGMTTLEFDGGPTKVLVATLDCRIYCISYNKFKPLTREVEFTYIPNGAKIISIGALKRGPNDFVIGITHSLAPSAQKSSTRSRSNYPGRETGDYGRLTYFFNIYASSSTSTPFDLDNVAQCCQTIRLRYVPYHLYQTEFISVVDRTNMTIESKPFWLLSGGDNCIHAFTEDLRSFNEIPIDECYPELSKLPGLALRIDVMNLKRESEASTFQRLIALGFEDGSIRLYHSVLSKQSYHFELVRESSFDDYTTIVPSVRLFKVKSVSTQSKLKNVIKSREPPLEEAADKSLEQINLLVVSSTNPSLIFDNVISSGLDRKYELPDSQRLDCAVTSAVGDTNLDGRNELLIGTHGRELMTYQYNTRTRSYYLSNVSELNQPIFAISIIDLTGDALKDAVILLANGILIMQVAVKGVIEICKRRVDSLLSYFE